MARPRKTHLEQYQEQCAAEDAKRPYRLRSEILKLRSKLPPGEVAREVQRILHQQNRERARWRARWEMVAQARDHLDWSVDQLSLEAQPLKRPLSPERVDPFGFMLGDFEDIDVLASSLKIVVEALIRYEALAKLGPGDPHPLNELNTVLCLAFRLLPAVKKLTEVKEVTTRMRKPRSQMGQQIRCKIEELAKPAYLKDPERTAGHIASVIKMRFYGWFAKAYPGKALDEDTIRRIIDKELKPAWAREVGRAVGRSAKTQRPRMATQSSN